MTMETPLALPCLAFLSESIEKQPMALHSPKFFGGHKSLVGIQISTAKFCHAYFQESIPANIIHTCHVGFHVEFSFIEYVRGCGPKTTLV